MAKAFISVPTKLLMLIVSGLLFLAIGFSTLSLSRLQDDYQQFQERTLDQGQAQFSLHGDILRSKLNVWLESFSEITQLSQQNDFTVFAQQLARQIDGLQFNLNVENVWYPLIAQEIYGDKQTDMHTDTSIPRMGLAYGPGQLKINQHVVGGEHSLKVSAPYLLWFGSEGFLKIWKKRLS